LRVGPDIRAQNGARFDNLRDARADVEAQSLAEPPTVSSALALPSLLSAFGAPGDPRLAVYEHKLARSAFGESLNSG
jgi:hypothetical protein